MRNMIEETRHRYMVSHNHLQPEYIVLNNEDWDFMVLRYGCVASEDNPLIKFCMGMIVISTPIQPRNTCHVYSLRD